MDFFARQERSRRTTLFLVIAFIVAFAAVVLATTAVTAAVIRVYADGEVPGAGAQNFAEWLPAHAGLLAVVACGTLLLMTLASLYRTATLSRGGGEVARLLGATAVTGGGGDPLRRRLVNVVEEMAIASGLPMPEVYVLEQESGINAFAAGRTPSDAAIAVTRGALERLDRAELQGVIAHEFSHILNGDMRINLQLMGLAFGILVLSLVGGWLLRAARFGSLGRRGRDKRGAMVVLLLGLAFTVIGAIGLFFSRLIKAAVSRQRERLADASAVQFTREPSALASALKKIGGYTSRLSSPHTEEVGHMLFEHGSRGFGSWFATHPPLLERIRVLDPSFDPSDYPAPAEALPPEAAAEGQAGFAAQAPAASAFGAEARSAHLAGAADTFGSGSVAAPGSGAADPLLARVGRIETPDVGGALHGALPQDLYRAAHDRESSLLLVFAMALSGVAAVREQQLSRLDARLGAARANRCERLHTELAQLDPKLRIPILELAMPALKQRPAEQLEFMFDLVASLTELETEPRLFDYVLLRMLTAYLTDVPGSPLRSTPRLEPSARDALSTLLAAVAAYGHEGAPEALAAYRAGFASERQPGPAREPDFAARAAVRDVRRLDGALARLARLRPRGKRAVLNAVLATIRHDRQIEVAEVELFRAIAATLGCPLPPAGSLYEQA